MALDRNLLTSSVTQRREAGTFSLVPKGIRQYEPPRGYLYNPPGALGVLSELGHCTKLTSASGCKSLPPLEIIHRDHMSFRKTALAIATILKRTLGWKNLRVTAKSEDDFSRAIRDGRYLLALDQLAVEAERPFGFLSAFRTGRATAGGFSSKEFDQILDLAKMAGSWEEARDYLRGAEAQLLRESALVPLFHGTLAILVSPRVKGFAANIWDLHPFSEIWLSR